MEAPETGSPMVSEIFPVMEPFSCAKAAKLSTQHRMERTPHLRQSGRSVRKQFTRNHDALRELGCDSAVSQVYFSDVFISISRTAEIGRAIDIPSARGFPSLTRIATTVPSARKTGAPLKPGCEAWSRTSSGVSRLGRGPR